MSRKHLTIACLVLWVLAPRLSAAVLASDPKATLAFPFEVNWEILRSGFNNTLDVALEADTYGEEWVLETRSNDALYLRTPRGTTRVIGLKSNEPSDAPFDILVIGERELAATLGIKDDSIAPAGSEIMIAFTSDSTEAQTFTFKANPKYFVSVSLRLSL